MTDAEAIQEAALLVSSAFVAGFAGFTFAFSTEFGGLAAQVFGLLLTGIA